MSSIRKTKVGIVFLFALLLGFFGTVNAVQAAAQISFSPATVNLQVGESALVQVIASDIPTTGLAALQFTANFDPAAVNIQDPNASPYKPFQPLGGELFCDTVRGVPEGMCPDPQWFLTSTGRNPFEYVGITTGSLQVAYATSGSSLPPSGNGVIAIIEVHGVATGVTAVDLADVKLADNQEPPTSFVVDISNSLTVTVDANHSPVLDVIGNQNVNEGANLIIALSATDLDASDVLSFSSTGLPSFCSLTDNGDGTGSIDCNPGFDDAGFYNVTVVVDDGTDSVDVAFTITANNINRAPAVINPGPQSSAEAEVISLSISASDADGDSLSYSAVNLPPDLSINPTTGEISGTLSYDAAGLYNVIVSVSDGADSTDSPFSWTVTNTNQLPVVTNPGAQSSAEAVVISLPISASDADGDSLSYSAVNLPMGLSINPTTGEISGTLSYDAAGTHNVTVSVSDGADSTDSTFSWTVGNTNQAPGVINPGDQNSVEGEVISLPISTSDADGDSLSYSAVGLPADLSINSVTGEISGTLSSDSMGNYAITVSVSDDSASIDTMFSWVVTDILSVGAGMPVAWTDRVGVTVDGSTLTKAAVDGWGNSGAASVQTISGDGAVEYVALASNSNYVLGLSSINTDANYNTIDYAIFTSWEGILYVYEHGVYRGVFGGYQIGDILWVERVGSTVVYKKNGVVFYTSTVPSTGELIADVALEDVSASIAHARIYGAAVVANDSDGDGLPDAWESANGLDPANGDDAAQDLDGDNISNLEEYQLGTDPAVMNGLMAPVINPPDGGAFESAALVSLAPGPGTMDATLYYTLDGSTPTMGSTVYSGPFLLAESATVKTIAVLDGYSDSAESSASFTISSSSTPVAWTDRVGVMVDGSTLTKTAVDGWGNSGAASVQAIPGDGAVEFMVMTTNTKLILGLSNSNEDAHDRTIDYAIFARDYGTVAVYENGVGRGDFGSYQSGDVLRVERVGSTIVYKQNGTTLYTSTIPSTGELIADAALNQAGSKIANARIYGVATIAADTDDDGLPDAWETANGLNLVNGNDASQDLDSDNISNLEEYQRGSDPAVMNLLPPLVSPDGGDFTNSVTVSLRSGADIDGATFYYTLDGSSPTTSSIIYSGPFVLIESTTVKAIAVHTVYADSVIASVPFNITFDGVPIAWTDRVGVAVDGGTLTKTAVSGWGNSGAASVQAIPGDGAVEFMVMTSNTKLILGLSNSNEDAHDRTIDYAILARDYGTVAVYENGVGRGDFGSYQSGDVLRVERVGSTIVYKQNGTVFYTSTTPSVGDLIVDAALSSVDAQIYNARIYGTAVVASDTDGDGIPDVWESTNGLDPANSDDAAQDLDGDNISNLEEYQRGTDPAMMYDLAPPTINPSGGSFESAVSVSLSSSTEEATIYYTLDDSAPTAGSAIYSNPFLLAESATVKAIAVLDGYSDSAESSASFTITSSGTSIAWTDRVGVSVDGNTLIKTEVTGWGNGGAASVQSIAGDGAVEFTAVAIDSARMLGLSNSNVDANFDTIGYAIYARNDDTLWVYENGTNVGGFGTYQSGDILRVERVGGTVIYKRNGDIIYTSTVSSTGDLIADVMLYDLDARLDNARITGVSVVASDTDGDGLPDAWESANGLDPANGDDAAQDLDGDNISNLEEYQLGTDPTVW